MLQVIEDSAIASTEVRARLAELHSLFLPYIEAVKEMKSIEPNISKELQRTSHAAKEDLTKDLALTQAMLQNFASESSATFRAARVDQSIMQEHLVTIRNLQLQSVEAQVIMKDSIETIKTKLSSTHKREHLRRSTSPLTYVEEYRSMRQSFNELRMVLQQEAHARLNNSMVTNPV